MSPVNWPSASRCISGASASAWFVTHTFMTRAQRGVLRQLPEQVTFVGSPSRDAEEGLTASYCAFAELFYRLVIRHGRQELGQSQAAVRDMCPAVPVPPPLCRRLCRRRVRPACTRPRRRRVVHRAGGGARVVGHAGYTTPSALASLMTRAASASSTSSGASPPRSSLPWKSPTP